MKTYLHPSVLLLALLGAGCFSTGTISQAQRPASPCRPDGALVGTWKDQRLTQLGPGWVRLEFNCDCTYSVRAQMLWSRIRDAGYYRIERDRILLTQRSGRQVWPYRFENGSLVLEEYPGEITRYRRTSTQRCP